VRNWARRYIGTSAPGFNSFFPRRRGAFSQREFFVHPLEVSGKTRAFAGLSPQPGQAFAAMPA
jgi:hypothetical protein